MFNRTFRSFVIKFSRRLVEGDSLQPGSIPSSQMALDRPAALRQWMSCVRRAHTVATDFQSDSDIMDCDIMESDSMAVAFDSLCKSFAKLPAADRYLNSRSEKKKLRGRTEFFYLTATFSLR